MRTRGPWWIERQTGGSWWIMGIGPDGYTPELVCACETEEDAKLIVDAVSVYDGVRWVA